MNDQKQWIPRIICLGLILGLLGLYQNNASVWTENQTANQAAVDAANAHNQEVLAEMAAREAGSASDAEESAALGPYQDGSYTASAQGFGGDVTVTVTIEGGYTVDDASGEDAAYFSMAEGILEDIMAAQSAEVDTVSGATFSSTGLKNAVAAALEEAS